MSERGIGAPADPEDRKIITLARASRARSGAEQGACVRDTDGRTYAATSVHLTGLDLSAVQLAVAMAVSSGAGSLEAAAVVAEQQPDGTDLALLTTFAGAGTPLWWAGPDGTVRARLESP